MKKKTNKKLLTKINKKGNQRISSELAIGMVVLVAVVVGGYSVFYGKSSKQFSEPKSKPSAEKINVGDIKSQKEDTCKSHYYSGESTVRGWIVYDKQKGNGVIVQIASDDVSKLPIKNAPSFDNFTVRLIDPTDAVRNNLKSASKDKPAIIKIKGYAEICHTEPPQISLQDAAVAFRKS